MEKTIFKDKFPDCFLWGGGNTRKLKTVHWLGVLFGCWPLETTHECLATTQLAPPAGSVRAARQPDARQASRQVSIRQPCLRVTSRLCGRRRAFLEATDSTLHTLARRYRRGEPSAPDPEHLASGSSGSSASQFLERPRLCRVLNNAHVIMPCVLSFLTLWRLCLISISGTVWAGTAAPLHLGSKPLGSASPSTGSSASLLHVWWRLRQEGKGAPRWAREGSEPGRRGGLAGHCTSSGIGADWVFLYSAKLEAGSKSKAADGWLSIKSWTF